MADLVTAQVESATQDVDAYTNKLKNFEIEHEVVLNEYVGIKKALREAKKSLAKALSDYYVVKEHANA